MRIDLVIQAGAVSGNTILKKIVLKIILALWELPWNRLQKPLACPAKPLKTLGGVLNPVSFSQQFPKSHNFAY
jgi:hypothetical protein